MAQSLYMQTQRTLERCVRERVPGHRDLQEGLDVRVLEDVARLGVAHVRGALSHDFCHRLLGEAETARGQYLNLPARVNGVQQRAEQLAVRIGDPAHPALDELILTLSAALAEEPQGTGVQRFSPTEARYMRYTGCAAGLGAHRDGKCYALLVCVFSIAGAAPFTIFGDGSEPPLSFIVDAGDLVLLRAPGFAGVADGRPRHAVGPPLSGKRVSLTLRTVRGRSGAMAERWSSRPAARLPAVTTH